MAEVAEKIGQHFCDANGQATTILGPKSQECYGDVVIFMTPYVKKKKKKQK